MNTYSFNQPYISTRGMVQFLARIAAQEFVNHVSQCSKEGQRLEIVNATHEVYQMLQVAVKPNTNWLLVGGALVAAGLLIAHISDPKAVKWALKEF